LLSWFHNEVALIEPVPMRGSGGSPASCRARNRLPTAVFGHISLNDLALVAALVFFGVSGAIPGIAPNQASSMTGTPASHLQAVAGIGSQLLVDLFLCTLVLRHWRFLLHYVRFLWAPLALAIWAVASICWSVDPLLTARHAIPFLLAAVFGALLPLRLPPRRLMFLILVAFFVLALWSAVLALAFPSIGLDASTGHGGDWQGAFTQKNACGRAMVVALAALLAVSCDESAFQSRLGPALLFLLFGAELILSGSRGAWILAAVVLTAIPALRGVRRLRAGLRTAMLVSTSGVILLLIISAAAHFQQIAPLLGRNATLSGRTEIWQQVWIAILHRPWLGYGFSAFWQGLSGPSWNVVVALHFVLFHAHNGFLEIWLELGGFGLALFIATLLRAAVLLWPELRRGRPDRAAWPLAILILTVLYDLDENTLLSFNGLFWVLYIGALVQVEQLAAERHASHRIAPALLQTTHTLPRNSAPGHASPLASRVAESPWI
jgi:exopolysaccharide production protein ExoQ